MCSIGEDDFGDDGGVHAMVPQPAIGLASTPRGDCKKCGRTAIEVYKLSFREPECRDCFLTYVRHKFRAVLGSSKILPRDAKVALVFDGGAASVVLLDMLYHAQTQNTFKRLHCAAKVVYLDDTILLEGPVDRKAHISAVSNFLAKYEQFESFILPVSGGVDSTPTHSFRQLDAYFERNTLCEAEFVERVNAMSSLTSRQDFLQHHRNRLIASATKHLNCQFAFQSDISSTLATQLLSAIALGRGSSAAMDVSLVDERLGAGIRLVRPLKDLNEAEVQLYLRAEQLTPPLLSTGYGKADGAAASLQNLTQAFISNLQQNFSSTVSTVFRTGDKIAPNRYAPLTEDLAKLQLNENEGQPTVCDFCHSALDYHNSTTLLAIAFSRVVSEAGTTLDKCSNLEDLAQRNVNADATKRESRLCYACRNIFSDCDSNAALLLP